MLRWADPANASAARKTEEITAAITPLTAMEGILRERSFIRNRRDEVPTRRQRTSGCGARASAAPRTAVAGANMKSDQSARTYDQVPQKTLVEVCPLSELKPGEMRLVEWEDLEIGVFNCAGTVYAIEDRCSHDDGPLVEGELDEADCTIECPRHGSLLRPARPASP